MNKYGHPDVKQTCFYYHIIASIDKIVDILKYNARDLLESKKLNKKTIQVWEEVHESILLYYKLFYKFDLKIVDNLSEKRDMIKNLVNKNGNKIPVTEVILLTKMIQILEIILDLTDSRMGLEFEK